MGTADKGKPLRFIPVAASWGPRRDGPITKAGMLRFGAGVARPDPILARGEIRQSLGFGQKYPGKYHQIHPMIYFLESLQVEHPL